MSSITVDIWSVQPSQLYISSEKLRRVCERFDPYRPEDLEPVPVRTLDGRLVYTDGHTRALAAHLAGWKALPAVLEEDDLDWEAYRICVEWCRSEGVFTVADLATRVVDPRDYERLWLDRCRRMHEELGRRRCQGRLGTSRAGPP